MSFYEWKQCKLKDIIEFNPKESIKKGSIVKKISMDRLEPFTKKINGYEETKFTSGSKFKNGDTLLARITPCLENGKTAYVDILTEDEIAFGSTEYIVLRKIPGITDKEYVYYLAISPEFRDIAIKSMNGSSGRQRVQREVLEESIIKLPLLSEQKKIAKILSDLDKKIEINNKINHNLENQIKLIFNRWFVEFEFPDNNGKMIKSEMGDIPYDWKIIRLRDICDISTINEKPYNNPEQTYEYFSLPAYDEGKLQKIEFGKNISSNKYMIDNDCILISKLNPTTKRIWNPLCKTINSICSTEFIVYKAKNVKLKLLCYEIINNDRFTEFLISNVTGSTGSRQRVKPQVTLNYKIPLPSTDCKIVKEFIDIAEPIHKKIQMNINENLYLTSLKNLLLPKLMNGEIDVSNIELKE